MNTGKHSFRRLAAGVLAASGLFAAPVSAQAGFTASCRNTAAEIRCGSGACEVETQSFTPMQLSLSRQSITLCAYSGCWSGPVDLHRTRGDLVLLHANLEKGEGGIAVVYDRQAKVATMMWGGFAHPMGCGG